MRLAYFVHDLSDAAVLRRVRMLRHVGIEVRLFGFDRSAEPPGDVGGAPAQCLGRTFDGRLSQRAAIVARQLLRSPKLRRELRGCDVIMARNLEMLVIALAARDRRARLAYECLDIHRKMISPGLAGKLLRWLERVALRRCDLVITSSAAFERAYFAPFQGVGRSLRIPVLLLENKVLDLAEASAEPAAEPRSAGPPWRVGWFGMLRCRKSFDMLCGLARAMPGQVEVVISGRPSTREFEGFAALAASAPGVRFTGAYGADDLPRMYRGVHFAWAIDYFEDGANSKWLLPNRIYESAGHGAVPVALRSVETGRWLAERQLGVLVDEPVRELSSLLHSLDADGYRTLEERSRVAPREWFKADGRDCARLAQALAGAG